MMYPDIKIFVFNSALTINMTQPCPDRCKRSYQIIIFSLLINKIGDKERVFEKINRWAKKQQIIRSRKCNEC